MAKIIREGEADVLQEVPISSLRSTKEVIDTTRYEDAVKLGETLEKTRISPVVPNSAIKVHPGGTGTPIRDVEIKYR